MSGWCDSCHDKDHSALSAADAVTPPVALAAAATQSRTLEENATPECGRCAKRWSQTTITNSAEGLLTTIFWRNPMIQQGQASKRARSVGTPIAGATNPAGYANFLIEAPCCSCNCGGNCCFESDDFVVESLVDLCNFDDGSVSDGSPVYCTGKFVLLHLQLVVCA